MTYCHILQSIMKKVFCSPHYFNVSKNTVFSTQFTCLEGAQNNVIFHLA
jgi:hypothetical protein